MNRADYSPDDFRQAARWLAEKGWCPRAIDEEGLGDKRCLLSALSQVRTGSWSFWADPHTTSVEEINQLLAVIYETTPGVQNYLERATAPAGRHSPRMQVGYWNDTLCDGSTAAQQVLEKTAARLEELGL